MYIHFEVIERASKLSCHRTYSSWIKMTRQTMSMNRIKMQRRCWWWKCWKIIEWSNKWKRTPQKSLSLSLSLSRSFIQLTFYRSLLNSVHCWMKYSRRKMLAIYLNDFATTQYLQLNFLQINNSLHCLVPRSSSQRLTCSFHALNFIVSPGKRTPKYYTWAEKVLDTFRK